MSETDRQPETAKKTFAELWLRSQNTLGGYVCAHVPDHALVEDVMQDVARQATANFDKYDHTRPFLAWLLGIARQRIADAYREKMRRPITFASDVVDAIAEACSEMEPTVDRRAEGLSVCIEKLSDRHRRLIDLKYSRQLSTLEIASLVGGSPGAIDTMIYRVRDALRRCINQFLES